jgi:hypothetical protein
MCREKAERLLYRTGLCSVQMRQRNKCMIVFCLEHAGEFTATEFWGSFTTGKIIVDKSVSMLHCAVLVRSISINVGLLQRLSHNESSSTGLQTAWRKMILEKTVVAQQVKLPTTYHVLPCHYKTCHWIVTWVP